MKDENAVFCINVLKVVIIIIKGIKRRSIGLQAKKIVLISYHTFDEV